MLIHPQFDPIALQLGPLVIRWYGLMYLIGFAAFFFLGRMRARRDGWRGINEALIDDLLFFGVLGVILGGRLGYVLFYKPAYYLAHPLEIAMVWQGGMAFHGGFLGVLVAMAWVARKHKLSWLTVTDFIAPLVPLGLATGRLGNFINGELWGPCCGQGRRAALGHGVRRRRSAAAPPFAALPVRYGGRAAVSAAVALFVPAAAFGRGVGAVSDRVRRVPLYRGILSRAGRLPRPAHAQTVDGAVAVTTDDSGRRCAARVVIPAKPESQLIQGSMRADIPLFRNRP